MKTRRIVDLVEVPQLVGPTQVYDDEEQRHHDGAIAPVSTWCATARFALRPT